MKHFFALFTTYVFIIPFAVLLFTGSWASGAEVCSGTFRKMMRFADANNLNVVMQWAKTPANGRSLEAKETSIYAADRSTTWILERRPDGYWKLQTNEEDPHCLQMVLDESEIIASLEQGPHKVSLEPCDDGNAMQRWQFKTFARADQSPVNDQTGYYYVQPGKSTLCLEVVDGEYSVDSCDDNDSIFLVEHILDEGFYGGSFLKQS